jgi:hypothetical protein
MQPGLFLLPKLLRRLDFMGNLFEARARKKSIPTIFLTDVNNNYLKRFPHCIIIINFASKSCLLDL